MVIMNLFTSGCLLIAASAACDNIVDAERVLPVLGKRLRAVLLP